MATRILIILQAYFYLIVVGISASTSLDVSLHKTYASTGGILSVTCHADAPITKCEFYSESVNRWFKISDKNYTERQTDIKDGRQYTYNGKGFQNGDCGIFIPIAKKEHNGEWICNVHFSETEVTVASVHFTVSEDIEEDDMQVIKTQEFVAINDTNIYFICQTNKPITKCEILPPTGSTWINIQEKSLESISFINDESSFYLYYGSGFENGDCGIFLGNIREMDIGNWMCRITRVNDTVTLTKNAYLNEISSIEDDSQMVNEDMMSSKRQDMGTSQSDEARSDPPLKFTLGVIGISAIVSGVLLFICALAFALYKLKKWCSNCMKKDETENYQPMEEEC